MLITFLLNFMNKIISTDFWLEHIKNILWSDVNKSIIELLWNCFDADAFKVDIIFEKNKFWWIECLKILDDWHWLDYDKIEEYFRFLWTSHKKYTEYSPLNRRYHWKKWQWRYSFLNLWKLLKIRSKYKKDEKYFYYDFKIDSTSPKDTEYSDLIEINNKQTWFSIEITLLDEKVKWIDIDKLKENIILEFADYIKSYSKEKQISIYIDSEYIDIESAIIKREQFSFNLIDDNNSLIQYKFSWEIVNWRSNWVHSRYFCTEEWTVLWSDSNTWFIEKDFWHSVYIKSELFRKRYEENTHELLKWENIFTSIWIEVKNKISNFYSNQLKEKSAEFIEELKKEDIYPYKNLPRSKLEEEEIKIYDIFLNKIHNNSKKIFSWNKESRKMILELIKNSLEKDPKNMLTILNSVVKLNDDDLKTLSWLVNKYTLVSLIKISKSITDKLSFLWELDHLIHWDINKTIKERAHLHKILEQELWVFWEGYIEWTSDKWMKAVLEKHIKILWRENLIENFDWLSTNIPDLFLYKQFPQSTEWKLKHLVIELKRPGLKLTNTELSQVKKYALEVSNDNRFDKEKTEWEFVLISNNYNDEVWEEITQENRPKWCAIAKPNYKVYVKTWWEILQWLKWKYSFLKSKLESFEESPENLEYIKENMPDIYENIFK